jgi:hypothetical protein
MWVTGTSTNSLKGIDGAASYAVERDANGDNFIAVLDGTGGNALIEDGLGLALNFGNEQKLASPVYLSAADWKTAADKIWGPSSEHGGAIVIHVFADAHARAISQEVNPTVYLRFTTRSDGDPASEDDLE